MNRAELYSLVWEKPIVHVAKQFGISDVGLRKICVKHAIPTPPLGYWAKLAHGKKVTRPALPPLTKDIRDHIFLTARAALDIPESVARAELAAQDRESLPENRIDVPTERPAKLHSSAVALDRTLRKSKPDSDGFVNCSGADLPSVNIGKASAERAVLLVDAFAKALLKRGHSIGPREGGHQIVVDDEPFVLELRETREKIEHKPTPDDLKRQAEHDERIKRFPQLYSARQVWGRWDYAPSGRLCLEISDPTQYRWKGADIVGRWHDRGVRKVDAYLGSAMVALAAAASSAKHRRAEAAEKAARAAAEAKRREHEQAQREREKKRREFLLKVSDEYGRLSALAAFQEFLMPKIAQEGCEPVDRMAVVLRDIVSEMSRRFGRDEMNAEITRLGLFAEDDPL